MCNTKSVSQIPISEESASEYNGLMDVLIFDFICWYILFKMEIDH